MENNPRCYMVCSCLLAPTQSVGQDGGRVLAICRVWCAKTLVSLAIPNSLAANLGPLKSIEPDWARGSYNQIWFHKPPPPTTCTITSVTLCAGTFVHLQHGEQPEEVERQDRWPFLVPECWREAPCDPIAGWTALISHLRALRLHLRSDRSDKFWNPGIQFNSALFIKHLFQSKLLLGFSQEPRA